MEFNEFYDKLYEVDKKAIQDRMNLLDDKFKETTLKYRRGEIAREKYESMKKDVNDKMEELRQQLKDAVNENYTWSDSSLKNKKDFKLIADEIGKNIIMKSDVIFNWLKKHYKDEKEFNNIMNTQKGNRESAVFDYIKSKILKNEKLSESVNEGDYDFHTGVADTIANNTAMNKDFVLKYLKKNYNDKKELMNMMAKYASKKDYTTIAKAIMSGKKLNEKLRSVKVTYDNGKVITTSMAANLSDKQIKDYFKIGKQFNIGSGEKDLMAKVKKVEILESVNEALNNKLDITKLKDSDAEKLLVDIEKYGKEGTDFKFSGSTLKYSDKMKPYVKKFVKEDIANEGYGRKDISKEELEKDLNAKLRSGVPLFKAVDELKIRYGLSKIFTKTAGPRNATIVDIKEKNQETKMDFDKFYDKLNEKKESVNVNEMKLKPTGKKDHWQRPIYKDEKGNIYVDIELGKGKPSIHTVTKEGEPDIPIKNYKIVKESVNEEVKRCNIKKNKKGYWSVYDIKGKELAEFVDYMDAEKWAEKNKYFPIYKNESMNEKVDVGKVISDLIDRGWSGDNKSQMGAVEILRGLATSDDPRSNKFMKALDDFTSSLKKDDYIKESKNKNNFFDYMNEKVTYVKDKNNKKIDYDSAVNLMDDDIREKLHRHMANSTPQEFYDAYVREHKKKYKEDFVIESVNKNNFFDYMNKKK